MATSTFHQPIAWRDEAHVHRPSLLKVAGTVLIIVIGGTLLYGVSLGIAAILGASLSTFLLGLLSTLFSVLYFMPVFMPALIPIAAAVACVMGVAWWAKNYYHEHETYDSRERHQAYDDTFTPSRV